jgi:hypothetical protein
MTSTPSVTEQLLDWLDVSPRERVAPPDWDALLAEAVAHTAAPQLFRNLSAASKTGRVPAPVMQCAMLAMVRQKQQVATLAEELREILTALNARGVTPILLKGAHLATLVYPEISHRPMADIDLLVRESEIELARQALLDAGYASQWAGEQDNHGHALPPLRKGTSFQVELHWTLTNAEDGVRLDLDALRARCEEVTLYGQRAFVLSAEDLLLYTCIHAGVMHGFGEKGLRPVLDVLAILGRHSIDWKAVEERARAARAARATWMLLEIVRRSCNVDIPLWKDDVAENVIEAARAQLFERPGLRLHEVRTSVVAKAVRDPRRLWDYVFAEGARGASKQLMSIFLRYGNFLRKDRKVVGTVARRTWRQSVLTAWMKKETSR